MSHITDVKCSILDLAALAVAATAMGLEMVPATTYKWYGVKIGPEPLPAGFELKDLGKCEYVLRLPDGHPRKNPRTYEVGVMKRKDGQPGYTLMFDSWNRGFGLMEAIGVKRDGEISIDNADQVIQRYKTEVTRQQLVKQGYKVNESRMESGEIRLLAMKR